VRFIAEGGVEPPFEDYEASTNTRSTASMNLSLFIFGRQLPVTNFSHRDDKIVGRVGDPLSVVNENVEDEIVGASST
jgi:hypothetical protein